MKFKRSKLGYKNMFKNISYDSISHMLSFLNVTDLIKMKQSSKEMKKIIEERGLIENAFKYKVLEIYPRLDEALYYNEPSNFKVNWINIYKNKSNPTFLKDAFKKSIIYQCDNIMTCKPLVMGIYNLTFDLSARRHNSPLSAWCYRACIDIIHERAIKLQKYFSKNGLSDYNREKFRFKVMIDWIGKSTNYIVRYLIPHMELPTLEEFSRVIFTRMIIEHFHISDEYEQSIMEIKELKETQLSHVIWSFMDNS